MRAIGSDEVPVSVKQERRYEGDEKAMPLRWNAPARPVTLPPTLDRKRARDILDGSFGYPERH